jgi:hypothetical protein
MVVNVPSSTIVHMLKHGHAKPSRTDLKTALESLPRTAREGNPT